jgi:hypothetical protein
VAIPEQQLVTWSHQPAPGPSRDTYAAVKKVLEDGAAPFADEDPNIFLQGSYANDTNVARDSDVDVVCFITGTFASDAVYLSAEQYAAFEREHPGTAAYSYKQYKSDVTTWLQKKYGNGVRAGYKAIYIPAVQNRRECDVLPAIEYRYYFSYKSSAEQSYARGICFYLSDGTQVVNFPKQHLDNCTTKHHATNSWFKRTVRVYKNMRNNMIDRNLLADGVAPSYFVEGMLHNVPDDKFGTSFDDTFVATFNYIINADRSGWKCANRIHSLFGNTQTAWSASDCQTYLNGLRNLWNNWN